MSVSNYFVWAILIVFFTTFINLSSTSGGSGPSRSWSSSSGSGWSSGGGHK
ncbi:MAG: hypothetical protein KBF23_01750 [Agitococcus sp.]|nr:hypothetical protein [Moraxellaceae bacterium]MBP9215870.1 hypothetical protein [Agitococcus sp.]MBK7301340.1 hypothetical protein [Moraxellaceae bacterium]MBK8327452.1 hypothetical protein [Moraxellaceae bacterium]MBK9187179.1 hypothetical protein [Moraxellaceae bacterium]